MEWDQVPMKVFFYLPYLWSCGLGRRISPVPGNPEMMDPFYFAPLCSLGLGVWGCAWERCRLARGEACGPAGQHFRDWACGLHPFLG